MIQAAERAAERARHASLEAAELAIRRKADLDAALLEDHRRPTESVVEANPASAGPAIRLTEQALLLHTWRSDSFDKRPTAGPPPHPSPLDVPGIRADPDSMQAPARRRRGGVEGFIPFHCSAEYLGPAVASGTVAVEGGARQRP